MGAGGGAELKGKNGERGKRNKILRNVLSQAFSVKVISTFYEKKFLDEFLERGLRALPGVAIQPQQVSLGYSYIKST